MKYLFSNIDKILERIQKSPKVLLLLDYDGTLTPIVRRPELARLKRLNRKLLQSLKKKLILGVISGRSLKDIKSLIKIPGIIYAGNHGLEMEIESKIYILPGAKKFHMLLDKAFEELGRQLKDIKGAFVEHKGLTLSVHYRCVKKRDQARVKRIFKTVARPFLKTKKIKVTTGKMVFEIRPNVLWDKGRAVVKIIRKTSGKLLPVYIGDDTTDEDVFKAIKKKGITVFVGKPKRSCAEYFVRDVGEVSKFLRSIIKYCEK